MSISRWTITGLAALMLAGCGAPSLAPAAAPQALGPVEAAGKKLGGIVSHFAADQQGKKGIYFLPVVKRLIGDFKPGSTVVAIKVGNKVATQGNILPTLDGKLILEEYNTDKHYVIGTHEEKNLASLKFGASIKFKFSQPTEFHYKDALNPMADTEFWLIMDKLPAASTGAIQRAYAR